jgi:hypothetical protein
MTILSVLFMNTRLLFCDVAKRVTIWLLQQGKHAVRKTRSQNDIYFIAELSFLGRKNRKERKRKGTSKI